MMIDRRQVFSGLAAFAAVFGVSSLAMSEPARAGMAAVVKFDYPHNPLHFRAMVLLRRAAKILICTDQAGIVEISATCRLLRGETGTYNPWHTTLYVFDGLYRATESLAEMGLDKDEINAALRRLDIEMELKHTLEVKVPST